MGQGVLDPSALSVAEVVRTGNITGIVGVMSRIGYSLRREICVWVDLSSVALLCVANLSLLVGDRRAAKNSVSDSLSYLKRRNRIKGDILISCLVSRLIRSDWVGHGCVCC